MENKIIFIMLFLLLLGSLFVSGCSNISGQSTSSSSDSCSQQIECKTQDNALQDKCPKGMVNENYPGNCGSYTDKNNNGICDLSE